MLRVLKSIAVLLVLCGWVRADSRVDFAAETVELHQTGLVSAAGTGLLSPASQKGPSAGSFLVGAQQSAVETRAASEGEGFSLAVPEPGTLGLLGTGLLGIAGLLRRKGR
jgi:hypothetical protein